MIRVPPGFTPLARERFLGLFTRPRPGETETDPERAKALRRAAKPRVDIRDLQARGLARRN